MASLRRSSTSGIDDSDLKLSHAERKKILLAQRPDLKRACGTDSRTAILAVLLVGLQLSLACASRYMSWLWYFASSYVVSATAFQTLFLAQHECAHRLVFRSAWRNDMLACMINLPMVFPFVVAFRHYHLMHHNHTGVAGLDPDLPSAWEMRVFGTRCGFVRKLFWLSNQILFYATRPLLCMPTMEISRMLVLNATVQLGACATCVHAFGVAPIAYLLLSLHMSGGLHPLASHHISEHMDTFESGAETFSYYGILNAFVLDCGRHVEHHDMPNVPWSRLHMLTEACPALYDGRPRVASWSANMLYFLTANHIGVHSRCIK